VRSIRSYLLSRLVAGTALVLGVTGVFLYGGVSRALEQELDRSLIEAVQGMASILFQTEERVDFEFSEQLMPQYESGPRAAYFELWFADGSLLERSPSLEDADLEVPQEVSADPLLWSAPLPDGRDGRFVGQVIQIHHVFPEEGPDRPRARRVLVVLAQGREELAAAQRRVLLICAALFLVLVGSIAAWSWRAVARGLEPAQRLAAALDAIEVEALPAGLEAGALPDELAPMARKADQLIRRVGTALERERRTTADIAHELRTPLSELRTVSEVALRDGEDPEGARRALTTVRAVAARMGRSVATLLELARQDMGARETRVETVPVAALLEELARGLGREVRERGLQLDVVVDPDATVRTDREALRIVLTNLLENAVRYADPAQPIACRLERVAGSWRLSVANRSPELDLEDLESLTQPFWRKDRARSDREHSGLGLALSSALASKAGLTLSFALQDGWLRATIAGADETA